MGTKTMIKAKVIRVVNGNTLDLDIFLGFGVTLRQRMDLARISPFDQFSEKGDAAKTYMVGHFLVEVPDVTIKYDRHPADPNRYLVEIYDDMNNNINDMILGNDWGTLDESLSINVLG